MPKIAKPWVSWEEFEAIVGGTWTPIVHTHVKVDIIDTPWAWADVLKAGSNLTDLATRQHAGLSDAPVNAHHAQIHASAHHVGGGDLLAFASITGFGTYIDQAVKQASNPIFLSERLRNGEVGDGITKNQIILSYNGGNLYSHAIKTRHHSTQDADNAIDFYVWDYGTDATNAIGTKRVMIIDGDGTGRIIVPKLTIGSFYLNSLIANNKVPDSYKWHGYTPAGLTIGHVLKATGAASFAFQANNLGGLSDITLGSLEEGETIMYNQASGKWIDAWGVEYDNPRLVWKMYTDFFSAGAASNDPWVGAVLINGTMAARVGETNHPGQVRLNSGDSTQSGYRWMTATDCILLSGAESSEFVFKSPINLSDVRIRLGFQDSLTDTAPTDGMYIDINGTTLKGITRNNGAETVTGTTYTISTSTWYRIKMALSTDKATATFWLYNASGTQLWTNTTTTNIPTGAGRTLGHGVVAWIGVAAGRILIDLDMMVASQAGTITR